MQMRFSVDNNAPAYITADMDNNKNNKVEKLSKETT